MTNTSIDEPTGAARPAGAGDADHEHHNRFHAFWQEVHATWPLRWADVRLLAIAYAAMVAIGVGVGFVITKVLDDTAIVRDDLRIDRWFADHRRPTLNTLSFIGSQLADTIVKIALTVIICAIMIKLWRRWLEVCIVAISLILEAMTFISITWIVGRPRPDVPKLDSSPVGSAFPSGHMAAAVVYSAIVVMIFWHTRTTWIRVLSVTLAALVPIIVGLSRMYRGMHFLTDVIAGALLGAASVVITLKVLERAARREGQVTSCC